MSYGEIELWVEALMCIRKADQMLQCPSKPAPEPGSEDLDEP
jgi:hypothetical protein